MIPPRRSVAMISAASFAIQILIVRVRPTPPLRVCGHWRQCHVLIAFPPLATLVELPRIRGPARGVVTTMLAVVGHVDYAWRRVRAMPDPARLMAAVPVVLRSHVVLLLALQDVELLVEPRALLAAVLLEAHDRVDAAYSRHCQRHRQEDGSAVTLLFVDLVVEGHSHGSRGSGDARCGVH